MKRFLLSVFTITIVISSLIFCYDKWTTAKATKDIFESHTHIIGSKIEFGNVLDGIIVNKSYNEKYNTLLITVTATCESCYAKINKLYNIINNKTKYKDVNVLFVVMGMYDNYRIVQLLDLYKFNYIVDENDELLKKNRYFSINQTYIINEDNKVLLLGDMFSSGVMRKIFINFLKN